MPRQERERRYIAEYMKFQWPDGNWQLNVELGGIPAEYIQRYGTQKAAALFRPTRPRVDAVKWTPDSYYLIESKIASVKTGIGDLMYYRSIIPSTPDLPFYQGQPIITRLVVPWMLDWLKPLAMSASIDVVVFHQPWIDDYVRERQHYFSREHREERREKMQLRKILGVD